MASSKLACRLLPSTEILGAKCFDHSRLFRADEVDAHEPSERAVLGQAKAVLVGLEDLSDTAADMTL